MGVWGELLQLSSDGDDGMGAKIKIQKNPLGFQQNPKISLDQKLRAKKSHVKFLSLKNFQMRYDASNFPTQKILDHPHHLKSLVPPLGFSSQHLSSVDAIVGKKGCHPYG